MEYIVLSEDSAAEMQEAVNEHIALGFAPIGGVSVVSVQIYDRYNEPDGHELRFYQAMITN